MRGGHGFGCLTGNADLGGLLPANKDLKIGSHMVFWSLAVFVTSTIHAILPFALEASSMNAAKKLASLVDTTFEHHK